MLYSQEIYAAEGQKVNQDHFRDNLKKRRKRRAAIYDKTKPTLTDRAGSTDWDWLLNEKVPLILSGTLCPLWFKDLAQILNCEIWLSRLTARLAISRLAVESCSAPLAESSATWVILVIFLFTSSTTSPC